jgi:hypothetical protein
MLLMKVVPLDVELEGWGNNANMVTPIHLQRKVHENINESIMIIIFG